ncbi:hypothetical protein A9Q84_08590 [Halobacteriovorax marinus]|uniref:Pseudouridine synthase RsuA/RluA-like domain-containing protein n=1 Tax=Halobacteriovorax marinus TaxID=97084 RepID=A0A1Y5FBQ3_9BACT|nr:hypothetical protein A9Q84_08590 [Halobacteriovorax marinus]
MQNNSNFCILDSYNSLEELLIKELLYSKSFIKKNFTKVQLARKILVRDEINIPIVVRNRGLINPSYSAKGIEILEEDENFLAVNKLAGLHGHPQNYLEDDTILNFIRNRYQFPFLSLPQESPESNLLYRLDRETSGVLIFAKNLEAYREVRGDFKNVTKEKSYIAIVCGDFDKEGQHSHSIKATGKKGMKMECSLDGPDNVSIEVKKLSYNNEYDLSLLKVSLGRGVRHQIRSQLSAIGYPILGDTLYEGKESARVYLHALSYEFRTEHYIFKAQSLYEKSFFEFFNLDSCL